VEAKKAGWRANHKRIHRLWIKEGLPNALQEAQEAALRGIAKPMGAHLPIRANVTWAMDFQFDQTFDGKMLKDPRTLSMSSPGRLLTWSVPSMPMVLSDA